MAGKSTRCPVVPLLPLPPELFSNVCEPLLLLDLARVAASSRSGCVIVECLPAGLWKEQLEHSLGIGLAMDLDPRQQWLLAHALREELRFWSGISKPLGLSASSGPTWRFCDMKSLTAARGMATDALAHLRMLDKDDVFGPWTRMSWMPQICPQRLIFSFPQGLEGVDESLRTRTQNTVDSVWLSTMAFFRACDATVPCRLSLRCTYSGDEFLFELTLVVFLVGSLFQTTSRGVNTALAVHFFSSSPSFRFTAPRCVSYGGSNGKVTLLSGSARQGSHNSGIDFARSRECKWVRDLLVRGEIQALALIDCVSYVT